jgi:hypothetical protein
MDGTKLQSKIYGGYGKAASRVGFDVEVYRSSSMVSPIAPANMVIEALSASFTTNMNYDAFYKPGKGTMMMLADATNLQVGDWLVRDGKVHYLADLQDILPIPVIKCNRMISIYRPSYGADAGGGYQPSDTLIAQDFPAFMYSGRDRLVSALGFPAPTQTQASMPLWDFWINNHTVGGIREHDIIVDEMGTRYEVDSPSLTSFGHFVIARPERP